MGETVARQATGARAALALDGRGGNLARGEAAEGEALDDLRQGQALRPQAHPPAQA
jgi:hypothetical protein